MNRILLRILMAFVAAVASITADAKPAQPADAVISSITGQVLAQSAALGPAADPAKLKAFIETTVMPQLDFRAMTARAVGPRWRSATDEQKARLMAGFESLLIKTYAGAIAQAAGATYKMKQTIALDATTVEVRSEVTARGGRDPIALHYRLVQQDDTWKIVDVSVLGVLLVPTYQTQFAQIVERSGGIDGLVQVLEAKSR
jgi:phospholipid transport system substrate-binding protein